MDCRVCGRATNRILIRRGTGICCNTCEKIEKRDIEALRALDYLWSINTKQADEYFKSLQAEYKVVFLHTKVDDNGA